MYPYNNQSFYPYQQKPAFGDEIKVVKGKASASQYPLSPNSRTLLMDADDNIFYILQSDAAGTTSIQTYRFEEIPEPQPMNPDDYITKEQLEEVLKKYELHPKQPQVPQTNEF